MAVKFFGVNFGGCRPIDVTKSGAATGKDVDVQVVITNPNASKRAIIVALQAVTEYVIQDTWPPA